jgi:hypothetical protein
MILKTSKRLRKFFNSELTDEMIWQEIIEDGLLQNIHQLRTLSAEAARALIAHEKRMQVLSLGITELPPDVATELAKYKGEKLLLNCVKSLSPESAKAISQFIGIKLMLDALKSVTLPVIGRLSTYRGTLHLDGVEIIEFPEEETRRAETVFGHLEFAKLSLAGIKKPSVHLLKALSRFRGPLGLNGLETLSTEEAEILAEHPGHILSLKGIKTLSLSLEKLLNRYKGFLDLSGVEALKDDALEIAALRSEEFILLSAAAKKQVEDHRKKLSQRDELIREEKRKDEERKKDVEQKTKALITEFEKFDSLIPQAVPVSIPVHVPVETFEVEKDTYNEELDESVLDYIELNLNYKINEKRKKLDSLQAKGYENLSENEKLEVQTLNTEIEELNDKIRSTLDILVERKELGAIVFTGTDDLVGYLKESGNEEDPDDALAKIDKTDLFGNSFVEDKDEDKYKNEDETHIVEGGDFEMVEGDNEVSYG